MKRPLVTGRKPIVGGCATVLGHACRHPGAHPRQSGSGDHGALGILDRPGKKPTETDQLKSIVRAMIQKKDMLVTLANNMT